MKPRRLLATFGAIAFLPLAAHAQSISGGVGGNGYYAVYQSYPNNALTGTTSETAQVDIAIPANTIGAFGMVRISCNWTYTNSANNKTLRIRFSNTANDVAGAAIIAATQTTTQTAASLTFLRNAGVTNSQIALGSNLNATGPIAGANQTASVDTTQISHVIITGQLASAAETITAQGVTVEVIHQ